MLLHLADAVARLRRAGAEHAEVRHVTDERFELAMRDGRVEKLIDARSEGFGVRVLAGGAWGFAARRGAADDGAALEAAGREALAVAQAAARLNGGARIRLAPEEAQAGRWDTPVAEDPFAVPLEEKLTLLDRAIASLRARARQAARSASAHLSARRQHKRLAPSD